MRQVSPTSSVIIGVVAGILVAVSVYLIDRLHSDTRVGAWGTLAAGLFNMEGATMQIIITRPIGIVAAFVWAFGTALIRF